MKKIMLVGLLLASSLSFAGDKVQTAQTDKQETFKLIHVADLDALIHSSKNQLFIFDANKDEIRVKDGLIPGAKALTKVTDYDTATVLPADKKAKLVFYCANTMCMASHEAAKLAIKAGYKNVSVMADGIEGWKKAGKPTDKFPKNS